MKLQTLHNVTAIKRAGDVIVYQSFGAFLLTLGCIHNGWIVYIILYYRRYYGTKLHNCF